MTYGLWRPDSPGNAKVFATEDEALAAVRRTIEARGASFVGSWCLVSIPKRGDKWKTLAEGAELVERALRAAPAAAPTSDAPSSRPVRADSGPEQPAAVVGQGQATPDR